MPFKSEKQRRYLWANEPEIARDWTDTYGSRIHKNSGGISQLVKPGPGRPGYAGAIDRNIANLQTAWELETDPDEKAKIKILLDKQIKAKGGFADKMLSGDAVEDKEKHDLEKEGLMHDKGMIVPGLDRSVLEPMRNESFSPHKDMALNPQDRQTLLAKLLKGDPASDLYDYSNVASYDEDPNIERAKYHEKKQHLGYHPKGDTSYVRGLEDLGNVRNEEVGTKMGESEWDKALAATAGHELTHGLLNTEPFRNIVEEMNLSPLRNRSEVIGGDFMPNEPNELLVRLLDMQRYKGEEAGSEAYLEDSPYAISKHPSGEYGAEGLKKTLARHSDKFYNRVDERKNYLRQQNAMQQMMNAPLGSRAPQNWKSRLTNRIGDWKGNIGRGIAAGWGAITGFPGMALSAFQGPQLTPQQIAMNNQFFKTGNMGRPVGIGTQQNPFQMTSGPFQGMNKPGASAFGSPTSQAMAQKWMDKYGDVDHQTQAMLDKKAQISQIAQGNQGGQGGSNMGMPQGNPANVGRAPGSPTHSTRTDLMAQGGLISLWPR